MQIISLTTLPSWAIVGLAAIVPLACARPNIADGVFACGSDVDCPPGFACGVDALCHSGGVGGGGGIGGGGALSDGGSSDGGFGDGGLVACPDGPGPGAAVVYHVTTLVVPDASATPDHTVGFDLDGHYTMSDEDGPCPIVDQPGGVDNQVAKVIPDLASFSVFPNQHIAAALESGEMSVTFTVVGYDGTADDRCVLVKVDTGIGHAAFERPAFVEGWQLHVDVGTLSLPFLHSADVGAPVTLYGALAQLDLAESPVTGELGGAIDLGDRDDPAVGSIAEWLLRVPVDDAIRSSIFSMLTELGDSEPSTVDPKCGGISIGMSMSLVTD